MVAIPGFYETLRVCARRFEVEDLASGGCREAHRQSRFHHRAGKTGPGCDAQRRSGEAAPARFRLLRAHARVEQRALTRPPVELRIHLLECNLGRTSLPAAGLPAGLTRWKAG